MQSFNPSKYQNSMVKKTVARTAPGKKQQNAVKQRRPTEKCEGTLWNPHNDAEKLPSGNLTVCHGQSPFFYRQTFYKWAIFHGYVSHNQRVYNLHYLNGDLLFYFFWHDYRESKVNSIDHVNHIEARQSGRQNPPMAVGRTIECSQTPLGISTMAVKHSEAFWKCVYRLDDVSQNILDIGYSMYDWIFCGFSCVFSTNFPRPWWNFLAKPPPTMARAMFSTCTRWAPLQRARSAGGLYKPCPLGYYTHTYIYNYVCGGFLKLGYPPF